MPTVIAIDPKSFLADLTQTAANRSIQGTNAPVKGYYLGSNPPSNEYLYYVFRAVNYGSGDWTLKIPWHAQTATAGQLRMAAAVSVWVPNTTTTSREAIAFNADNVASQNHIGTTPGRPHELSITLSAANLGGVVSGNMVCLRVHRDYANETGGIAGNVILSDEMELSYSDT